MGWSAEWAGRLNGLVTLSFWASHNSLDDDEIKILKTDNYYTCVAASLPQVKMSHALNLKVVVSRIRARRRGREIHATVQENEVCFPNT